MWSSIPVVANCARVSSALAVTNWLGEYEMCAGGLRSGYRELHAGELRRWRQRSSWVPTRHPAHVVEVTAADEGLRSPSPLASGGREATPVGRRV